MFKVQNQTPAVPLLTSQTFELLEVIGFRSQYILQPNGQTFVAELRRLLDPLRIIADDLPFGRNVLLQKLPRGAEFCGHRRPNAHFSAQSDDFVREKRRVIELAGKLLL